MNGNSIFKSNNIIHHKKTRPSNSAKPGTKKQPNPKYIPPAFKKNDNK